MRTEAGDYLRPQPNDQLDGKLNTGPPLFIVIVLSRDSFTSKNTVKKVIKSKPLFQGYEV